MSKIVLKSLHPNITTHKEISDIFELPLYIWNQYFYDRVGSPFECKKNDEILCEPLYGILLKVENIDRIYYINNSAYNMNYELYCRIYHDKIPYFVCLLANGGRHGFDCKNCSGGVIYFCKSPQFYLQHIICLHFREGQKIVDKIYNSLVADGYKISPPDVMYHVYPKHQRNVHSLSYLAQKCIYRNRDILYISFKELPVTMMNSLHNFIIIQDWLNTDYK